MTTKKKPNYRKAAITWRKKTKKLNHTIFEDWHEPACRLAQCAECFGMTVRDVVRFPELLKAFQVKKTDEATQHKATKLHREQAYRLRRQFALPRARRSPKSPMSGAKPVPAKDRPAKPAQEPKQKKPPAAKDEWGTREGTASYQLNCAVRAGARSAEEMAAETNIAFSRCKAHVKWLAKKNLIKGDEDGFELL